MRRERAPGTAGVEKFCEFYEDAQLLKVVATTAGDDDRQVFTSVALLSSVEQNGYFTNIYQICLADAEEGGIVVAHPTVRAEDSGAGREITATLTFNDEEVTSAEQLYPAGTIDEVEGGAGEQYMATIPRYGCVITRFTTKRRADWR